MHGFPKRAAALVAGALILLAGSATLYAYWTAGGAGSGSATTGSSTALTVNQTSVLTAMYPGDTAQTLSGDFDNASGGTIHVDSVTISIASVTQGGTAAVGCTAADYTLSGTTMNAVQDVAIGTGVGGWSGATIQFNNTTGNQDACQGATVNFAYAVS